MDDVIVKHNEAETRFEADVNGALCVADYTLRDGAMVMTHTFVPVHLRDRGIAEKMVRAALEFAREQRLRVVPECWYVAAFIRRHVEFQPLISA